MGDGMGLGACLVFEAYLLKKPKPREIADALVALGNRPDNHLFWGGSPSFINRMCRKYESAKPL